MPEEIVFSWTGAARAQAASTDPCSDKPAWARVAGFGCAALSSTSPPITGPHWILLEEAPIVGSIYPLRVWLPFRGALGDAIWVVYPPPASNPEVAEWCDGEAALPTGGLARCRLLEVLSHDEPDPVYVAGAWLQVAIEEAIALPDLAARFAPDTAGTPLPPGITSDHPYTHGCHWGDLHYLAFTAEGDVHEWAVWQRHPGGAAVVLAGERIFDDDMIYAGHRTLSAAELREVEACQADAERGWARTLLLPTGAAVAPAMPARSDKAAIGRKKRRGWRVWERWRSRPLA